MLNPRTISVAVQIALIYYVTTRFSGLALWTKNRYGHLDLFPDVRYGRFDFMAESIQSLWTKNVMADPENPDIQKPACAMDVSTLRTAAVRNASQIAMDAGHSGLADRSNRYGRP